MAELFVEDKCVAYFRCQVGPDSYGFSLINVAQHDRQWVADIVEAELIRAFAAGYKKGDDDRIKSIRAALSI